MILTALIIILYCVIGQQITQHCKSWHQKIALGASLVLCLVIYLMHGEYMQQAWHTNLTSQETKMAISAMEDPDEINKKLAAHCQQQDAHACFLASSLYLQQDNITAAHSYAKEAYTLSKSIKHLERYALTMIMLKQPFPEDITKTLVEYAPKTPRLWMLLTENYIHIGEFSSAKITVERSMSQDNISDKKLIQAQCSRLNHLIKLSNV